MAQRKPAKKGTQKSAKNTVALRPRDSRRKRLHAIIKASAPVLSPKLSYGMPAYAKDDKVVWVLPKRAEVQDEVRDIRLQ